MVRPRDCNPRSVRCDRHCVRPYLSPANIAEELSRKLLHDFFVQGFGGRTWKDLKCATYRTGSLLATRLALIGRLVGNEERELKDESVWQGWFEDLLMPTIGKIVRFLQRYQGKRGDRGANATVLAETKTLIRVMSELHMTIDATGRAETGAGGLVAGNWAGAAAMVENYKRIMNSIHTAEEKDGELIPPETRWLLDDGWLNPTP
jgi:hypothetical protein